MKHKVKNIVNVLLTFFIMIMLIITTILGIIQTYSNKDKLVSRLEEMKIYEQIYSEVQSGFEEYIYQSGLEVGTFKNICDKEKIKKDFLSIMDELYEGKECKIDIEVIKQNLDKEIQEFVKTEGRKLTVEEEENIKKFEDLIANSYGESISAYRNLNGFAKEPLKDTMNKLFIIEIILIISITVLIGLIKYINRKDIFNGAGFIGSAMLSAGAILVIAKSIIIKNIDIDNIIIYKQTLSNVIIHIAKSIISKINNFGVCYIAIGIFIILMTSILGLDTKNEDNKVFKAKKKEKNKTETP